VASQVELEGQCYVPALPVLSRGLQIEGVLEPHSLLRKCSLRVSQRGNIGTMLILKCFL